MVTLPRRFEELPGHLSASALDSRICLRLAGAGQGRGDRRDGAEWGEEWGCCENDVRKREVGEKRGGKKVRKYKCLPTFIVNNLLTSQQPYEAQSIYSLFSYLFTFTRGMTGSKKQLQESTKSVAIPPGHFS
ncbi:hypothetical protein E2C01_047889 [Portunus trituberculatus]|uniref:Uncharacterized protein n=1 Tax=Portunus trituberculatus TaxID=210409 RepID=A0A5B7GBR8_PORTR|nr:hypothetical protein [Portunus trituberculatus]